MTSLTLSSLLLLLPALVNQAGAWILQRPSFHAQHQSALGMAAVGIFYGTSTGSTQEVADLVYQAFGSDVAAEPVDVDTLEADGTTLAAAFGQHDSLVVGTPTWNTGSDTHRSGTGWDELYYDQLPQIKEVLNGKKVAVFGLGDQESYAENYADATGELFDVFEGLGCRMLGAWSQEGYEHEASKSIRGDKFCGLLLDVVNQEELTEERVKTWVAQLIGEGLLDGESRAPSPEVSVQKTSPPETTKRVAEASVVLEEHSTLLNESIASHSSGGFTPHHNSERGTTMWTSPDGRKSFVTVGNRVAENPSKFSP
ncbi:hypothetical protein ACA910_010682 [Epithemia clementina (nom. ined.)]